jgi:hypothetical protein
MRNVLLILAVLLATLPAASTRSAGGAEQAASSPAVEEPSLLDVQTIPLTAPSFAVTVEKPLPPPVPESMVVDARCRLIRETDTGWFALDFPERLPAGFPNRMRVLPGRELETLEALTDANSQAWFRVTGQTTSYAGRAYILLLSIAEEWSARPEPSGDQPRPSAVAESPTTQPAGAASPADDTERIRRSLTKIRPPKPIVPLPPAAPPPEAAEATSTSPPPTTPPAGDILINRVVRIAPSADGQWLEARFEADNTLQERPIPLLPCQLLERAAAIRGKVCITGIVRYYKGRNYLLLRKALAERDMGQL